MSRHTGRVSKNPSQLLKLNRGSLLAPTIPPAVTPCRPVLTTERSLKCCTRSGSFDIATAENVVMHGSLGSALEMLAALPYTMSIETVFVIGG
jgi:hypothetical protein